MRKITLKQALSENKNCRTRVYVHRKGSFALTANFRNAAIDQSSIRMVAVLIKHFTQAEVADMMDLSVATVSKMVRCASFNASS